ncbi:BMP family protein [Clostridia bacterium]|nr:BMP family protein [Clostridia bacterium]
MSLKKLLALGLVLIFAIAMVAGCAPAEEEPAAEEPAAEEPAAEDEAPKAALLTSGPINDGGWNSQAYEGLLLIEERDGYEVSYTENVKQDDQVNILRDYARKGYDVIIGHGFEYGDALTTVAAEFPEVKFAQVGGFAGGEQPNLMSGVFRTGELGYVMAVLSAELTESNHIGFVGAMEIPTILDEVDTIQATMASMYPDVEVSVAYTGSWVDIAAGKEAAKAMISQGVDVIIGIGDACDAGAIQACEETEGVWFIGWSGDLNVLSPDLVATSGVQDVAYIIGDMVNKLQAGEEGSANVYGIAEGAQPLGTWAANVPEEAKAKTIAEWEKFASGEYNIENVAEMIGK